MRCCDSLPPISPRFVSFAWRYHRCVRCSSPPAPDAEPWINLELVGGISGRLARWKRQGLPSSRRNPCDHSPYSSDPGVTRQAEWTVSELPGAAPATDHDEGSTRCVISGLNRTAFDLAVYASQGWSPTHHARLASGCWSGSTRRDWLPAGFHLKGFKLPTILLSRAFLARGQSRFPVFAKGPGEVVRGHYSQLRKVGYGVPGTRQRLIRRCKVPSVVGRYFRTPTRWFRPFPRPGASRKLRRERRTSLSSEAAEPWRGGPVMRASSQRIGSSPVAVNARCSS